MDSIVISKVGPSLYNRTIKANCDELTLQMFNEKKNWSVLSPETKKNKKPFEPKNFSS